MIKTIRFFIPVDATGVAEEFDNAQMLVGDLLKVVEITKNAATIEITLQRELPQAVPPPDIGVQVAENVATRERFG